MGDVKWLEGNGRWDGWWKRASSQYFGKNKKATYKRPIYKIVLLMATERKNEEEQNGTYQDMRMNKQQQQHQQQQKFMGDLVGTNTSRVHKQNFIKNSRPKTNIS